jgi:hypothetical protein
MKVVATAPRPGVRIPSFPAAGAGGPERESDDFVAAFARELPGAEEFLDLIYDCARRDAKRADNFFFSLITRIVVGAVV